MRLILIEVPGMFLIEQSHQGTHPGVHPRVPQPGQQVLVVGEWRLSQTGEYIDSFSLSA